MLSTLILFLAAKPDLGLICASYPFGIDKAKPVGIITVLPGSIIRLPSMFAPKSIPDEPLVSYFGKETCFDNLLINLGSEPFKIEKGLRIAQMVICPIVKAQLEEVDDLNETERGDGGFGSTGIK